MGGMEPDWKAPGYRGNINKQCVTLAEALKVNGYATYMTGKWHLTRDTRVRTLEEKHNWPCQRGFDRFYGTIAGAGDFYAPATLTSDNEDITKQARDDKSFYYTDAISDNTVKFINEHCKRDPSTGSGLAKPFFHYVAYTAPHWPLHALDKDRAKYKGVYDGGWDKLRESRLKKIHKLGLLDSKWAISPSSAECSWDDLPTVRENMPVLYYLIHRGIITQVVLNVLISMDLL